MTAHACREIWDTQDYEVCFRKMADTIRYRNVASRMMSGHSAYAEKTLVCLKRDEPNCNEDVASVIAGACSVHFITMW